MGDRPLLIMFVGVPGSGKSTFSSKLADELRAVYMNSDAIRLSMWGSVENIRSAHTDPDQRQMNNQLTFGALDYAAAQIIAASRSVVYDCNANSYEERARMAKIASNNGGNSVVIRIDTPTEVAVSRLTNRVPADGQTHHTLESAERSVAHYLTEIKEPLATESFIRIDGEQTFEAQYEAFLRSLTELFE